MPPELAQEIAFPTVSVMVTIVLLNVDWIWAMPLSTFFRSLRLTLVPVDRLAMLYSPPYFFLPAMVRRGPFRVRALVLVLCPFTGKPLRCRSPR